MTAIFTSQIDNNRALGRIRFQGLLGIASSALQLAKVVEAMVHMRLRSEHILSMYTCSSFINEAFQSSEPYPSGGLRSSASV
jgi:hypothetical protein